MIAELRKPSSVQAILVMDSRKTAHALRSQNFSGTWSQLYKAGDCYLDLSLRPEASGAILQGNIVAEPGRYLNMKGLVFVRKGQTDLSTSISPSGSFRLELDKSGQYGLEIVLPNQVISINKLEI